MGVNWMKVALALEQKAKEVQDVANANAIEGQRDAAVAKDETAFILRTLASALRHGLT